MKKYSLFRFLRNLVASAGVSRHGALSALRARKEIPATFAARLVALIAGSSCIGTAVAFLVQADLGLSPYDVFSSGVASRLPLTLGQAGWLLAGVLFLVATVLGRRPGPWGITFIVANGLAVDAASSLLNQPELMVLRLAYVAAAVLLFAVGVSLVLDSGTTGGPFELIMLAGEDRGISKIKIRYALDFGVFSMGLALGGSFGPATVIHALTFGLVLKTMLQAFADRRTGRHLRIQSKARPDIAESMVRHPATAGR